MADIPGLNSIQELGRGTPRKVPEVKPAAEGAKVTTVTTLEGLLLPIALAGGATAVGVESQAFKMAIGVTTGFKLAATPGASPNPAGAALFLLPQPIGMLPERFFMSKPRIPGTRIFIDPLYTLDHELERLGDARREAARVAQIRALDKVLPDLTDEELLTLATDTRLHSQFLPFVGTNTVQAHVAHERALRRAEDAALGGPSTGVPSDGPNFVNVFLLSEQLAALATGDLATGVVLQTFLDADTMNRENPPDP
jgi:hypothetical protein